MIKGSLFNSMLSHIRQSLLLTLIAISLLPFRLLHLPKAAAVKKYPTQILKAYMDIQNQVVAPQTPSFTQYTSTHPANPPLITSSKK